MYIIVELMEFNINKIINFNYVNYSNGDDIYIIERFEYNLRIWRDINKRSF